jgi:DNA-binding NarL/FixJ family response regulator
MKILIADDHAVVRHGLMHILSEAFRDVVVGEARDAGGVLLRVKDEDWDAVVLDLTMPGCSGLEALQEIKLARPRLPVLILSVHPEDQLAVRTLKAGAAGYLTKESAPEELVHALRKVVGGGIYVSPSLAEKLASSLDIDPGKLPYEALSNREYQVMYLIASGKTVTAIAEALSLSVKTVSTYRAPAGEDEYEDECGIDPLRGKAWVGALALLPLCRCDLTLSAHLPPGPCR